MSAAIADENLGATPVREGFRFDVAALADWIAQTIPAFAGPLSVQQFRGGQSKLDNMIFHPTEPRVLAVLDWELSTLGRPLADFADNAMMYRMPPDIVAGLDGVDPQTLNLPSEADYVAAYCRRTGRDGIEDDAFHVAFNFFRLAAIFHGIKGRVARGTAASAQATARALSFPRLARIAWDGAFLASAPSSDPVGFPIKEVRS